MSYQEMIFQFIGGLGIFLFGIKYMGDGLQSAVGDRLRDILDYFVTNPFMGVLTGIFVTALIQSSSGTAALTVGLVSAGIITLRQAISIIMGANIGTTVTAFIIGIDIGAYALPIIAVGALFLFFFKYQKITSLGMVVFGFGALFFGLELMSAGMKPLRSLEAFKDLMVSMSDNPVLGVVIGTVFTLIVQSSSATIGILQELFTQEALTLNAALPILLGDNIGTTIIAVIASLGASVSARRAAGVHVMFNAIGTISILIFLVPFTMFIELLQGSFNLNPAMTIVFAHGTFNVTNTIIQFPFIAVLAWVITKWIPSEDDYIDIKPQHLNPVFIEHSPSIALGQAKEEMKRMTQFSMDGLNEMYLYMESNDKKHADYVLQYEEGIDLLDKSITDYLVQVSSKSLSLKERTEFSHLVDWVRNTERIGDYMGNIVELIDYKIHKKVTLSEEAIADLKEMYEFTRTTLEAAYQSVFENNIELARTVLANELEIDRMERALRKKHIQRLNKGESTGDEIIIFVDIISNLERIGDHATNIARDYIHAVTEFRIKNDNGTIAASL